jgi:hypothetical protein
LQRVRRKLLYQTYYSDISQERVRETMKNKRIATAHVKTPAENEFREHLYFMLPFTPRTS